MAIDILSVAAMSAEPERLFSRVRRTLTDQPQATVVDTLEAIECLKSMMVNGVEL